MTSEQTLQTAAGHHQAGRLDEAEPLYRQLLAQNPDDAETLHLMGLLTSQRGDIVAGRDLIGRAIAIRPTAEVFHINYASLSAACGFPEAAVAGLQKVIELNPNCLPLIYVELGQALASLNRNEEAVHAFEWAVKRQPMAEWYIILAETLQRLNRHAESLQRIEQALQLRPDSAEVRGVLGYALQQQGRLVDAMRCYRDAITIDPKLFAAYNNLGCVLNLQEKWGEAVPVLEKAIALRPDFVQAHCSLGLALGGVNQLDEAETSYQRALELNPQVAPALEGLAGIALERRQFHRAAELARQGISIRKSATSCAALGRALVGLDQFDEAIDSLRQAVELAPDAAEAHVALGLALQAIGRHDEALAAFRRTIELDPRNHAAQSHLLRTMVLQGTSPPDEIFAAHCEWGRRHTSDIAMLPPAEGGASARLRIGYVSANFREHPLMSFIFPIVENYDPDAVEVFCYSDARGPDEFTAELKRRAHQWRDVPGLSDSQLAHLIRADGIDVLVDLTGHADRTRLRTFAARPAPVQLSYLGSPATTGLTAIDYFLTDEIADPPPQADGWFTEQLHRLAAPFLCYAPPAGAATLAPLPVSLVDHITFGCQADFAAITPRTLQLWARILIGVPESRLLLQMPSSSDVLHRIRTIFTAAGVDSSRIEPVPRVDRQEYFERYNRIDIALEPASFNSPSTVCDAAWMGCPTVSLAGEFHPYRQSATILRALNLDDFRAGDDDQYVRIAVAHATNRARLVELRNSLRETMLRSPLTDGAGLARKLESAFRKMRVDIQPKPMTEPEPRQSAVPRIVILGGGFAGVYTALRLEKNARHTPMKITLINRSNYFLMTPLLFEAGSGVLEPRHAVSPIRSLLENSRFIQAEVHSVNLEKKTVAVGPGTDELHEIPYDHLVIAVGGTTNLDLIPGSENAITFKTLRDAIFLRNHLIECFEQADIEKDPERRVSLLAFVIAGAGLVGTELAGEMSEFIHNIAPTYKHIDPASIRLELIEAGKRIVPEMEPQLSAYATKILTRHGVNVRLNSPVKSIERRVIHLEKETIASDTIILVTGVKPSPLVDQLNLEKNQRRRIVTEGSMLVRGQKNIWCLGDCAAIPDPSDAEGRPYPQLAQHALREAKLLADNIARSIADQPLKPFVYSNKGVLASLGHFRGTGRVYKFRIYGFLAWWVWRTYYLLQMPRWPRRIRIMIDWTVALFFKNDVVELDLFGIEHPWEKAKINPSKQA